MGNVLFTFLPILVYAIIDRPRSDLSELGPLDYVSGRKRVYFNQCVFVRWMSVAFLQAGWLTVAALILFGDKGLLVSGCGVYAWVIFGANLTISRQLSMVHWLFVVATAGSVLSYPLC